MTKAPDFPAKPLPTWHWAWPDGVTPVWAGCSWEDLSAAHLQTSCPADISLRTVVKGLKDWKLLRFSLFYILKHAETLLAVCWVFPHFFLHVVSLPVKGWCKTWSTLSFLVAITLLTEKYIYYWCCSLFKWWRYLVQSDPLAFSCLLYYL